MTFDKNVELVNDDYLCRQIRHSEVSNVFGILKNRHNNRNRLPLGFVDVGKGGPAVDNR